MSAALVDPPLLAVEGRRERKKRQTRLALKAAALDLVASRGFAHVTVEDIANAVDVSVRTFFNYFDSKEAALVGEDPLLLTAMRDELIALPDALSPFEALRTVLLDRLEAIREDIDLSGEDHRVWQRRFALVRSEPEVLLAYTKHLAVLEALLCDALVERLGGDDRFRAYAALLSASALGVLRVAGTYWGGEGGFPSLVAFTREAFEQLARGFGVVPITLGSLSQTLQRFAAGGSALSPAVLA
jgi:AcrR family transcriptional regulator